MGIPAVPTDMKRIVIVGSSGSGKTTLARSLAAVLGSRHIELDALRFLPGWQTRPTDEFRSLIDDATDVTRLPCWVSDGNYRVTQDLTWGRADTLV